MTIWRAQTVGFGCWRTPGPVGQLTGAKADSGFVSTGTAQSSPSGRRMDVTLAPSTIRQSASLRSLIEAMTRAGLDAHPLLDGGRRRRGRNQLHSLPEQALILPRR